MKHTIDPELWAVFSKGPTNGQASGFYELCVTENYQSNKINGKILLT